MNTKTNAPAAVAQLNKGAEKSSKETTVQTDQATKPASNAANKKGTEVATAEKTPALTHKAELAELVSERQNLGVKIGDGTATAEDFDKVREIADKIKALTENRAKSLAGLKAQVVSLGLEPLDLFETTQVKQAYSELFPQTTAAKKTTGAKKGVKRPRKALETEKLIISKSGQGGGVHVKKEDLLAEAFGSYAKVFFKNIAVAAKDVDAFHAELVRKEAFTNDGAEFVKNEGAKAFAALYKFHKDKPLPPK